MIAGPFNTKIIAQQLGEVVRLAASIQQGTVTTSLILRKLSSYPRQNGLALALREIGRIERSFFMLAWLEDPVLRRRVTSRSKQGRSPKLANALEEQKTYGCGGASDLGRVWMRTNRRLVRKVAAKA
jgi:TnpA family transposase